MITLQHIFIKLLTSCHSDKYKVREHISSMVHVNLSSKISAQSENSSNVQVKKRYPSVSIQKTIGSILLSLVFNQNCQACFIIFLKDENNILVANHEDWFASDAAIKINRQTNNRYGSIIFTIR